MAHETELAELTKVPEAIRRLQASSRRALPITLIGLAATLIAAGISTYYAFYLSGQLDKARSELTATKLQLESTRAELNAAGVSLLQVQKYAAPSQQTEVRAALESVARGERKLSVASATLAQAASRLPTTSAEAKPDPALPAPPAGGGSWFAVVGSYPLGEAGLEEARGQATELKRKGQCAEVWQTEISKNYAVVLGGALDESSARKSAAEARRSGMARDAFAQRDRNWRVVIRFPNCGVG